MTGNKQATVFIGNLDERVNEAQIYEIMVQAGPIADVYIPRDKETRKHRGYGFAEYTCEKSAAYAVDLFSGLVFLSKKQLRFQLSGGNANSANNDSKPAPKRFCPYDNNKRTDVHNDGARSKKKHKC